MRKRNYTVGLKNNNNSKKKRKVKKERQEMEVNCLRLSFFM